MLISGDFVGNTNYRGNANNGPNANIYTHGFPSVSNINNNGYPSQDFGGNNDHRRNDYHGNANSGPQSNYHNTQGYPSSMGNTNSNNGPNSNIYTHGFPSVSGQNPLRGGNTNYNYGSNSNSNGYPNQDSYGKTQYSRDPNTDSQYNSGGNSYNHPSGRPTNDHSHQGPFNNNPNMANGPYPQFSEFSSKKQFYLVTMV